MHVGSILVDGTPFLIHFHVHPRGVGDLAKDLRFRDALRADPALRDGYARIKSGIVGPGGTATDRAAYQAEKGDWILEQFDRLGIPRPANIQFGHADGGEGARDEHAGGTQGTWRRAKPTRRHASGSSSAADPTSRRPSGRWRSSTSWASTRRSG
jgi:hypothetical protein